MFEWLPKIELDHRDLFGAKGDIKKFYDNGHLMWTHPEEAPPFLRKQTVGFMSLEDKDHNDFGTFVPELYELAKVNGLKAQQERAEWVKKNPPSTNEKEEAIRVQTFRQQSFYEVLYHVNHPNKERNHKPKTPFELAVLDVIYNDGVLKKAASAALKIGKRVTDEYLYRIQNNQALPPHVPKYQIESDYLKNLDKIGLKAVRPRDIDLNLPNPPGEHVKGREKWLHYFFQRIAFIQIILAAMTAALVASTMVGGIAIVLGVILAEWCGKEFGVFSTAESLLRHLSNFSEEFRWGNKISLKKTVKTTLLFAALSFVTYGVVTLTWAGVMSLPWWNVATTGLSAKLLTGLQYSIAGIASGMSGVATYLGAFEAVLFFWGFGILFKQIDFNNEQPLIMPNVEKRLEAKIIKLQQKLEKNQRKLYEMGKELPLCDLTFAYKPPVVTSFISKQDPTTEKDLNNSKDCISENLESNEENIKKISIK